MGWISLYSTTQNAKNLKDFLTLQTVTIKKNKYNRDSQAKLYTARKKFVSYCKKSEQEADNRFYGASSLYFYDIEYGKETHRLKGGEALISYISFKKPKI